MQHVAPVLVGVQLVSVSVDCRRRIADSIDHPPGGDAMILRMVDIVVERFEPDDKRVGYPVKTKILKRCTEGQDMPVKSVAGKANARHGLIFGANAESYPSPCAHDLHKK